MRYDSPSSNSVGSNDTKGTHPSSQSTLNLAFEKLEQGMAKSIENLIRLNPRKYKFISD